MHVRAVTAVSATCMKTAWSAGSVPGYTWRAEVRDPGIRRTPVPGDRRTGWPDRGECVPDSDRDKFGTKRYILEVEEKRN